MIIKLQSPDPEKLGKKESSRGDAWISLGKGNRLDFAGGLGVGGNRTERDQVVGMRCREKVWKETVGVGRYLGAV